MPRVTINGFRMNYLQAGEGPDLVMLHGLGTDLSSWYLRAVPLLKDRWRVTVYDLRGHGYSDAPPSGYTTADMAGDLIALLDHLGIERPHLLGHSFGGGVALHHAMLRPDRVESLVLAETRVPALQPIPPFDDEEFWENRRRNLIAEGMDVPDDTPRVFYMLLEEMVALKKAGELRPGDPPARILWNTGSRRDERCRRLINGSSLSEDVRQIAGLTEAAIREVTTPTLLTYGALSRCLVTCRGLEKCLSRYETVVHPRLGHFFPMANPEVLVADLEGFLLRPGAAISRTGTGGKQGM